MPQYEFVCEEDGSTMTLLRSMRDADLPVEDPEGRGRVFRRALSAPMIGASTGSRGSSDVPLSGSGGCCPCGKPGGGCGG
jgi:predicted nucleic acid-binding Zn ribbon protein